LATKPEEIVSTPILVKLVESQHHAVEGALPYLAIFVSVFALGVSFWQVRETMVHDKLAVLPNLSWTDHDRSVDQQDGQVGVELDSTGLGPAVIYQMSVFLDGKPFNDLSFVDEQSDLLRMTKSNSLSWRAFWGVNYMPPGAKKWLLWTQADNIGDWGAFEELTEKRLKVVIVYCSVYRECWSDCVGAEKACDDMKTRKAVPFPSKLGTD
jgi:hypothetical protein